MTTEIQAIRPGPLVTVQDLGRPGLQRFGVAEGGVMDRRSHKIGAALLGQPASYASLEMVGIGGTFRTGSDGVQAVVTGADMALSTAGLTHPHQTVVDIPPATEFEIGAPQTGVYCYMSFGGGVVTEPVLGSRSTHVRSAMGGLSGAPLKAHDVVPVGERLGDTTGWRFTAKAVDDGPYRFMWGLHAAEFSASLRAMLGEGEFLVTSHRDRMGIRLTPPQPIVSATSLSLPSSPVVAGDIQVPGDGHPVVLLADRQPTGGYPRIATIIDADRDRFAQELTGATVRFTEVTVDEATDLMRGYHADLASLGDNIGTVFAADRDALWRQNLISGVTVGEQEPDQS